MHFYKFQDISEIDTNLEQRLLKYTSLGLTQQPSIFAVENNRLSTYYVVFHNIKYKFQTILKAVAIAFFIFQVYNLKYPFEATNSWTFIQRMLFKLVLKADKLSQIAILEQLLKIEMTK